MLAIKSSENIQIKYASSLKQKKYRDAANLFLIEGTRLVETAVESNAVIKKCFCTPAAAANNRAAAIIENLAQKNCPIYEVSENIFHKLSDTNSPQGIIAVGEKTSINLSTMPKTNKTPIFIIMDQLQDPGNVGTIIRTADATGINGIISLKGTVDLFSPKVVRASMGSIFHLPIIDKITVEQLQFFLQENQLQLLSTVISKNAKPCFSINYKIPSAIAFGNEGAGISPQIKKLSAENIFIPMYGQAESLNASCAAAIIMYEIMRQKHFN